MSLLSICTKVYFAVWILVNSPLENFRETRPVEAEVFHADRPYFPSVISLLKSARTAIRIKLLQQQYDHCVVRLIYDLYVRSNCEVYFLRRRLCFFNALTIGIYKGIGSVILISIFYRRTDIRV